MEPVFAVVFAYIFEGETLSARGFVGAALVLLGVLFAELNLKKLFAAVKSHVQAGHEEMKL